MTPVEAICKAEPGGIVEFPDDAERILRRLEAAGFDVVERPKLGKRPVAFRVLGTMRQWKYYDNEHDAALAAERNNTEYQGLYVRDGT